MNNSLANNSVEVAEEETSKDSKMSVVPKQYLLPFAMVTSLFSLWGFANDITNPMVAAFKKILLISNFESSLVQAAFYGGYCFMAIPAAIFIKKFGYKAGILSGLILYAAAALFFPVAGHMMSFHAFLLAYFVMTCGLSFLETTSNPYILSLGPKETATQRLNLAQAFNPLGSLTGMFIASNFILAKLNETSEEERVRLSEVDPQALASIQSYDLQVLQAPYFIIGLIVLFVLVLFIFIRIPEKSQTNENSSFSSISRLLHHQRYREGVIAQAFYVGAQIMCWTFIIQYAGQELGWSQPSAQNANIIAMVIFASSRFICTFLLKFFKPGALLTTLSCGAIMTILGTIFLEGEAGLYSLVCTSACMSLMFPTIYGIALDGLGEDAKFGAAGLILAIGGGCLMPPMQAIMMDITNASGEHIIFGISSYRFSFILPLICFIVISIYGQRSRHSR
jgi:FHS family L-fucose permease-like MFS transporter